MRPKGNEHTCTFLFVPLSLTHMCACKCVHTCEYMCAHAHPPTYSLAVLSHSHSLFVTHPFMQRITGNINYNCHSRTHMFNQNHLIPWMDMIQKTIPSGPSDGPSLWLSQFYPPIPTSVYLILKLQHVKSLTHAYICPTILITLELIFMYLFCLFCIHLKKLFIAPTIKHLMLGQTVLIHLERELKQSWPNLRHYPGICLEGEITIVSASVRI